MTTARVASLALMLTLPIALWVWIINARNDVAGITRSFIRQIQTAETRYNATGDYDASTREGIDRAFHAWFTRYRYQDGSLEEQLPLFEQLWHALKRSDPETTRQLVVDRWKSPSGRELPRRVVGADTRSRSGRSARLRVEWVQLRGNWTIRDARVE